MELVPQGDHRVSSRSRTMSKSEQCLGNSSHLDLSPSPLCQRGGSRPIQAAQAGQGPQDVAQTPKGEGGLCRLPRCMVSSDHTPCLGPSRSVGGSPSSPTRHRSLGRGVRPWSKGCKHVLHSSFYVTFFKTGEDFDDDL